MIVLLVDPHGSYVMDSDTIIFDKHEVPKSRKSAGNILRVITTMPMEGQPKKVAFMNIDELTKTQAGTLSEILFRAHKDIRIVLTALAEYNVDELIKSLGLKTMHVSRDSKTKELNFYQNLLSYLTSRKIPNNNELFIFFKVLGHSPDLCEYNKNLLLELDKLLFKTHNEYIATAWAGLHRIEKIRLVFPRKRKQPPKIEALTSRKYTNAAKKKRKQSKKKIKKTLGDYF